MTTLQSLSANGRQGVGPSSLALPQLGMGCGPLGGLSADMSNADGRAVLSAAWDAGIRYFDTAPWYGNTRSEHRLGEFLRERSPDDFIITTKIGRVYKRPDNRDVFEASHWRERWPGGLPFVPDFDYTYDGVFRSYEDSLARLGVPKVHGLAIHDLDIKHHKTAESISKGFDQLDKGGGYRALCELRDRGEIQAIGVGINLPGLIGRFLEKFKIDYFVLAMPYTLLDQTALAEDLPLCLQHESSIIIGAPFASGILATGAIDNAHYAYAPAETDILERVSKIERIAERHGVPLAAAALQFPLAHPAVAAVIPGAETADHATTNAAAFQHHIPAAFWDELVSAGLINPDAPLPSS